MVTLIHPYRLSMMSPACFMIWYSYSTAKIRKARPTGNMIWSSQCVWLSTAPDDIASNRHVLCAKQNHADAENLLYRVAHEIWYIRIYYKKDWSPGSTMLRNGCQMLGLKAFIEDITVIIISEAQARWMLGRLDSIIIWCRTVFKQNNSRGLSLRNEK